MGRTFTIKLGEREFTMHPFNFKELRRMTGFAKDGLAPADVTFQTFLMAMERAEPAITPEQIDLLEFTQDEFQLAMRAIMLGGKLEEGDQPGEGKGTAEGPA